MNKPLTLKTKTPPPEPLQTNNYLRGMLGRDIIVRLRFDDTLDGKLVWFDRWNLMLNVDGHDVLVFKHAIDTITNPKGSKT
ncbi:RNA chaperone Hfq [Silicimonas sp. MF1-12-2]|uniref:RNA chaperone Hfq n=1 Tax=Silicimonas sp. MF1-12-2 TaxID=3384793 RepID=UPI0039B68712